MEVPKDKMLRHEVTWPPCHRSLVKRSSLCSKGMRPRLL